MNRPGSSRSNSKNPGIAVVAERATIDNITLISGSELGANQSVPPAGSRQNSKGSQAQLLERAQSASRKASHTDPEGSVRLSFSDLREKDLFTQLAEKAAQNLKYKRDDVDDIVDL